MALTHVAVVVLSWNDGDLLTQAVRSTLDSTGVDVSVIVVDNGSRVPPQLPDDPRITLVRNPTNLGVAPARAQGVRRTECEWVCFLDSDARLHPGALRTFVDVLAKDGNAALIGPVFAGQERAASGGKAPTAGRKLLRGLGLTELYATTPGQARGDDPAVVDFVIGACQFFRRDAYEAVGGLDESIFYGPEDVDLCLRLKDAGYRILQSSSAGCHHPPRRRNRSLFSRRGARHAVQVVRHLTRRRLRRIKAR